MLRQSQWKIFLEKMKKFLGIPLCTLKIFKTTHVSTNHLAFSTVQVSPFIKRHVHLLFFKWKNQQERLSWLSQKSMNRSVSTWTNRHIYRVIAITYLEKNLWNKNTREELFNLNTTEYSWWCCFQWDSSILKIWQSKKKAKREAVLTHDFR